mmetsp:Transcript_24751/g.51424  ORF Transcript_24751/g.51424 Transcript_24751/m.51424 type:complete len:257 (-) Transcript_24751:46-816(-)
MGARSRPRVPGKLVGPADRTGKYMCVSFSGVDENSPSAGADPEDGLSLLEQVKRGPCSRSMLLSCVGFVIPACIHLYKHQHWADLLAGFALLCVSVSSPLCDAYCVWAGVLEDGKGKRYDQTALAVGKSEDWVAKQIQEKGALPQVLATDRWNNLTRLIDRAVCVSLVAPATCLFAIKQRPRILDFLVVMGGFAVAWTSCVVGNYFRKVYPCGIKRKADGTCIVERSYWIFMRLHEVWHYILITIFSASALYRPVM